MVGVLEAPRFYPSAEEFSDFSGYVERIEKDVGDFGLCVVVPPSGWKPRKSGRYDDVDEMSVQKPIRQEFTGSKGVYYCVLLESRSMPVKKFRGLAEDFGKRFAPEHNVRGAKGQEVSEEESERYYWRNIRFRRPVYGADIGGSLFDDDVEEWNPGKLGTVLDLIGGMPGVTMPYLYFGMYGATFAWHTEDMDLYSINYIHHGKPKSWYFIPQAEKARFEGLCRKLYASHFDDCKEFLRHKLAMLAPEVLHRNGLTYGKATHREGEFVIVFPGVYHAGFNHGFNCAESVNFASERWLDWGRKAKHCQCRADTVSIDCEILEARIKAHKLAVFARECDSSLEQPAEVDGAPKMGSVEPSDGLSARASAEATSVLSKSAQKAAVIEMTEGREDSLRVKWPLPIADDSEGVVGPSERVNRCSARQESVETTWSGPIEKNNCTLEHRTACDSPASHKVEEQEKLRLLPVESATRETIKARMEISAVLSEPCEPVTPGPELHQTICLSTELLPTSVDDSIDNDGTRKRRRVDDLTAGGMQGD